MYLDILLDRLNQDSVHKMSITDLIKLLIEKAMKEYCPDVVIKPKRKRYETSKLTTLKINKSIPESRNGFPFVEDPHCYYHCRRLVVRAGYFIFETPPLPDGKTGVVSVSLPP